MPINLPDIVQRVVLDVDRPVRSMRALTQETERFSDAADDASGASRDLTRDQQGAASAIQRTGERARDARGRLVGLGDGMRDTARETGNVDRRSSFLSRTMGALGQSLSFARGQTGRLFEALRLLRFPAIILGVQLLGEAMAALGGSVLGLAGALAPLGGLLATVPGLIAPIIGAFAAGALGAAGMGDALKLYTKAQDAAKDTSWADAQEDAVNSLAEAERALTEARGAVGDARTWDEYEAALEGVRAAEEGVANARERQSDVARRAGGAQSEYEEALSKMHPAARAFIEQLNAMRPLIEDLRRAAQGALFPGLTEALRIVAPLIRGIQPVIVEFGRSLGTLAADAARMMAEPAFRGAFTDFMMAAARNLLPLGGSLLDLARGFMQIVAAAQPLTDWLVGLISNWAALFARQQEVNAESGRTAGFFDTVRRTAELVGPIIADIGRVLRDVLAAAAPVGRILLETFGALIGRTADFTGSVEGQTTLRDYFMAGLPAMLEFFRLIGDIGKALFTLSSDEGLAPLFAQIRTQLLPVFLELLNTVSGPLGSALIDMATEGLRLFVQLAGTSGPLFQLIEALTGVFRVVGTLIDRVPGLDRFIMLLMTAGGAVRAFSLLGMVTGVSRLLRVLNPATGGLNNFIGGMKDARSAARGVAPAAGEASKGLGGMIGRLAGAHPVALAVIGVIAAIGGALYALYRNNEGFRRFIDRLWQTIQRTWDRILGVVRPAAAAFIGFIGEIIEFVSRNWRTILAVVAPVLFMLITHFNTIKTVAVAAFKILWASAKDAFEILRAVWENVGRPILDRAIGWFNTFKEQAMGAWHVIRDNVIKPLGEAWSAISGPVGAAFDAIGGAIGRGIDFVKGVVGGFLGAVAGVLDVIGLDHIAAAIRGMLAPAPASGGGGTRGNIIGGIATRAMATGGTLPAAMVGGGFRTAVPRAIVGEGSRAHAEYVIPTDPRHRQRALGLFGDLASELGMQGGGIIDRLREGVLRTLPIIGPAAVAARDSLPGVWPRIGGGDFGSDMFARVFNQMRDTVFHIAGVQGYQGGGVLPGTASGGARALRASVARSAGPRSTGTGGSSTSVRHGDVFQVAVNTVDRPTGERLGRDIAWALIGSRGSAVQSVIS